MSAPSSPIFLSVHDIALILQCSSRSVRRMIDAGKIKAVRILNRWMVEHKDWMAYIEQQPTNNR